MRKEVLLLKKAHLQKFLGISSRVGVGGWEKVGVRRWVTQRPLCRPYNRRSGGPTASAEREAAERASSDHDVVHPRV